MTGARVLAADNKSARMLARWAMLDQNGIDGGNEHKVVGGG